MKIINRLPLLFVLMSAIGANASNLANPATLIPEARVAVGASYHLGGYSLTDSELPSLFNRIHGRVEYGPFRYLTIGVDGGATQIEVDRVNDTMPVFHGKFGFSGGGHLKLSTPSFLNNRLSVIAIAQVTLFNSENEFSASYSGKDGTGIVGMQFYIPGFGFISAGPWVYVIQGSNKGSAGQTGYYSNTDNVRGWLAIDFFPKLGEVATNKPYFSLEISVSPKANYSDRIPVQAFSVSLSFGTITKRLYGVESDVEWNP
ncbi:MAG: hypothetical protein JW863_00105 [Chitinispirillaceae bacterium]|nr:hypothetical protein [Chitinispirillaceae bacterium]